MIEPGSRAGFPAKTLERLRVLRHFIGKEFQGDEAAKFSVLGLVHDAHAAATDFFDNSVVRYDFADHGP